MRLSPFSTPSVTYNLLTMALYVLALAIWHVANATSLALPKWDNLIGRNLSTSTGMRTRILLRLTTLLGALAQERQFETES